MDNEVDVNIEISECTAAHDGTYACLVLRLSGADWSIRDETKGTTDAIPTEEYHHRVLTLTLESNLGHAVFDADHARAWAEEHSHLLKRVAAGHTIDFDDRNMVGVLDADASAAWDELEESAHEGAFLRPRWEAWDAGEWIQDMSADELAKHTAEELVAQAREECAGIAGGADAMQVAIEEWLAYLADDEPDEPDEPAPAC